jgi:hypothetical protein
MKALKVAVADALARKRASQAAAAVATRGKAPAGKSARGSRAAGGTSPTVSSAAKLKRVRQMARVRARNARNQAKRDGRG